MNLKDIKSIRISLLKKESEINKNLEADYSRKFTATFEIPENFPPEEELYNSLIYEMYTDLIEKAASKNALDDVDSIGMWIEYDSFTADNAISLQTLDDIGNYGDKNIDPVWEFFKMTLEING